MTPLAHLACFAAVVAAVFGSPIGAAGFLVAALILIITAAQPPRLP